MATMDTDTTSTTSGSIRRTGATDWQAIRDLDAEATDADLNRFSPDSDGKRLELPEGVQGGYVRLVVIYRDEGACRATRS